MIAVAQPGMNDDPTHFAAYQACIARIQSRWPTFASRRRRRLQEECLHAPAEKVAENILEDLFTYVLDWPTPEITPHLDRADMILSTFGVKQMIVAVRGPGELAWPSPAVTTALRHVRRNAARQKVESIAVSDGNKLYAADIRNQGLRARIFVPLDAASGPHDLWWISVHGIYRPCSRTS
jgi:hypothetical protein